VFGLPVVRGKGLMKKEKAQSVLGIGLPVVMRRDNGRKKGIVERKNKKIFFTFSLGLNEVFLSTVFHEKPKFPFLINCINIYLILF
jgi:hypothetical protein